MLGNQTPTLACYPPARVNYDIADAAIDLAAAAGLYLDEWQQFCVREIMVELADGRPAAFEAALVIARQNGKNAVLEACELGWMFLLDLPLTIHSAHRVDTSQEHYLRMRELIEGYPVLSRRLYAEYRGKSRSFVETNGKESIKLKRDKDHPWEVRLLFKARAHGGSRGFTGDRLVLDEAYDLPARMIGNAVPALRARPRSQVVYTSSPPHYSSAHLHGLLKRAEDHDADAADRLFLAAWLNDADIRLDDEAAWARVNPALGARISLDSIRQELRMMSQNPELRAEFMRECAGIPEGGEGQSGDIPYDLWTQLHDKHSRVASDLCYGLSVSPDGAWCSIASVGHRSDGKLHVDTVDRRYGTDWVVARAVALYGDHRKPLYVNAHAAEGSLINPLTKAGVELVEVSSADYQHACGEFLNAVKNDGLRHLDQESMNRAVAAAGKRDVGKEGAFVWVRPGAADISPLTAVTQALTGIGAASSSGVRVAIVIG